MWAKDQHKAQSLYFEQIEKVVAEHTAKKHVIEPAEDASIARKTANHYIDYVRMLLLWGARVHGIHHPPLGSIQQFSSRRKAKLGHGRQQDRTPLTWDQLEKLLSAADVHGRRATVLRQQKRTTAFVA